MGERVPQESIVDAAEVVAEKLDLLLERATDSVLGTPLPGSPQWLREWDARDTAGGRAEAAHRARVKAKIAALAIRHHIEPAPRQVPRPHHRRPAEGSASQQLAIW